MLTDGSCPMDQVVCQKQAACWELMAKNYNKTHKMYSFKVGDIVTVAILSKDKTVNNPPRMKAEIIAISHKNYFWLWTEYGVLANYYSTSELNLVPPELLKPLVAWLAESNKLSLTLTLYAAAALRSLASHIPVNCEYKMKCDTQWCICVKLHIKCTQYYHSGYLYCSNLPLTVADQTKILLAPQNNKPEPYFSKKKQRELTSAKLTKKALLNCDKPLPCIRGLQPTTVTSLLTWARLAKTLAQYLNMAKVVAQLASICLWTAGKANDKKGKGKSRNNNVGSSNNNVDSDANKEELEAKNNSNK